MAKRFLIIGILTAILLGCKGKAIDPLSVSYQSLRAIPQHKWDELTQKKVYFGRQSVGGDILEGLETVLQEYPAIQLEIREGFDQDSSEGPAFSHFKIGRNRDPKGKIDHFRTLVESGIGDVADIAFFKFCYVDVDHKTEIEGILDHFDKTLADLSEKYPDLTIIPVTVPLTNKRPGIKAKIKRILGMEPPLKADNIKRNKFNDHIREKHGAAVWDLADAEATSAKGEKVTFRRNKQRFFLLNRKYTSDGGHLNSIGSQVVAIDLLLHLTSLVSE
jgi:hypothetical protein